MEALKIKLLNRAARQNGGMNNIKPCHDKTFAECYQVWKNKLILYFNVPCNGGMTTKVLTEVIE